MNIREAFDAALAEKFTRQPFSIKSPNEEAKRLGNDWYDLRVQPIKGESSIRALRVRWIDLISNPLPSLMYDLREGMHVEDPETEEFDGVRVIQRKIHSFLPPEHSPDSIVQRCKRFSTGAEVFIAGIIDLSDPSLPYTETTLERLGMKIRRQATSGDKLRLEHVVPAAKLWLDSLR